MATKTWTGSSSTGWNDGSNWNPLDVPGIADDVVIGTTANPPTLDVGTTVNAITINGSDTLTLISAAVILTVTNGITLSSTGGISGAGAVNAAVTASGAPTITANGGTLEVIGAITDSGNALILAMAAAGDRLLLDATSAANSVTFVSTSTLELNIAAQLTVGSAMAIGAGTLQFDRSSTLTDASGVTLSTGIIVGAGTLKAAVTATGAATITASGGTLEVTGPITDSGNSLVLNIAGATDRLLLDAGGAANAVTFGTGGRLVINDGAELIVGSTLAIGSGTLVLDASFDNTSLTDQSGITIGTGTITGSAARSTFTPNSGINAAVTATGAALITTYDSSRLELVGPVIDAGGALTLTSRGVLILDAASSAHTLTFVQPFSGPNYIELRDTATLTVSSALTISQGTVKLDGPGSTLTDANGITITDFNGISGQGIVNAALSGNGSVAGEGGTLRLTGPVSSGVGLMLGGDVGSALSIENTATAAAQITINLATQTLAVGSSGNLTINGGTESISNGTIKISTGGQLSDSSGFTIGSGALLFGQER